MKKKISQKSSVEKKINKFPIRVFIPEAGWCPKLDKSASAGYRDVLNETDYEAVKHLIGENKSIFRGEKI